MNDLRVLLSSCTKIFFPQIHQGLLFFRRKYFVFTVLSLGCFFSWRRFLHFQQSLDLLYAHVDVVEPLEFASNTTNRCCFLVDPSLAQTKINGGKFLSHRLHIICCEMWWPDGGWMSRNKEFSSTEDMKTLAKYNEETWTVQQEADKLRWIQLNFFRSLRINFYLTPMVPYQLANIRSTLALSYDSEMLNFIVPFCLSIT